MTFILGVLIFIWVVIGVISVLTMEGILAIWPWTLLKPIFLKQNPTQPVNQDKEAEAEDEDDAMTKVAFFSTPIVENKEFYQSLTVQEQAEFAELFIKDSPKHLEKSLQYQIGGDNTGFFSTVFNSIFKYRKIISLSLLVKIYQELIRLAGESWPSVTLLNEAMIRTAYARRKDADFLKQALVVSQADVLLQQQKLNPKHTFVYSYKRLAIILEKQKAYDQALHLVEDALKRHLTDKTVGEYAGRKARLLEKKSKK